MEGPVTEMEAADVDDYFHSRSRGSQIGAAISQQSRPLGSREELEAQVPEIFPGASGRGAAAALLERVLRPCRADRVLDKWAEPPSRPVLIYPRFQWLEEHPPVSMKTAACKAVP